MLINLDPIVKKIHLFKNKKINKGNYFVPPFNENKFNFNYKFEYSMYTRNEINSKNNNF